MSIRTVGIIGAGTMGNGIAQACAVAGIDAVMLDIDEAAVQKGIATISGSLDRLVKKEKMTVEQKAAAMARIKPTTQMAEMKGVDIVIEAATENEGLKLRILKEAETVIGADTIIASNTSSISITQLAAATDRAAKFIGMHFFNPVPMMALVELIRGLQTSDETHAKVEALAKAYRDLEYDNTDEGRVRLASVREAVEASLIEFSGRPVYYGSRKGIPFFGGPDPGHPYFDVKAEGLMLSVVKSGAQRPPQALDCFDASKHPLPNLTAPVSPQDDLGRTLVSQYYGFKAEAMVQKGDFKEARAAFDNAAWYCWAEKEGMNNLGGAAAEMGFLDLAEKFWLRALEINPRHHTSRQNLIKLYENRKAVTSGVMQDHVERKRVYHNFQGWLYVGG